MQTKKQSWSERIKRRNRAGFSLVELIVIVAMMAVLIAVLAPSLLGYVERSRAQKDVSAMDEVVNAVFLAMADPYVYDELAQASIKENVSCYIDNKDELEHSGSYVQTKEAIGANKAQYMFGDDARQQDEVKFYAAGSMRGTTLTFIPNMSSNESKYLFGEVIVNKFFPDEAESINNLPRLYNAIRSVIGDTIELSSQTYRNSEYTIFIKIGSTGGNQATAQDAMQAYGQFSGTNLSLENREYYIADNRQVYEPEIGTEPEVTVNKLATPVITIDGSVLNITAVNNATEYKIFNGDTLLVSTSATSVDLSNFITEDGAYTIKVQAVGGAEYSASDYVTIQYAIDAIATTYQFGHIVDIADHDYYYVYWKYDDYANFAAGYVKLLAYRDAGVILETKEDVLEFIAEIWGTTWEEMEAQGMTEYDVWWYAMSEREYEEGKFIIPSVDGWNVMVKDKTKTSYGEILSEINGIPVVTMTNTFLGCENLQVVPNIPESVTYIGQSAFGNCISLETVVIPAHITHIRPDAFEGCENLTSVSFENQANWYQADVIDSDDGEIVDVSNAIANAQIMKDEYANNCHWYRIETVTTYKFGDIVDLGDDHDYVYVYWKYDTYEEFVPGYLKAMAYTEMSIKLETKDEVVEFAAMMIDTTWADLQAQGVTENDLWEMLIPRDYFNEEVSIYTPSLDGWSVAAVKDKTKTTYGEILSDIDGIPVVQLRNTFSECNSMTVAPAIPESVIIIGDMAFFGCSSLTEITIPANVMSIGQCAFQACPNLTSVIFEMQDGWYICESPERIDGVSMDVSDPTENARYMRGTGSAADDYWYRVEQEQQLAPGLYETGAIELWQAGKFDEASAMLKVSWDEMVASGVIAVSEGPQLPEGLEINEYGFYYGVEYSISVEGMTIGFTFNEDSSAVMNQDGEMADCPAGLIVYGDHFIDMTLADGPVFAVSEDGAVLAAGGICLSIGNAKQKGAVYLPGLDLNNPTSIVDGDLVIINDGSVTSIDFAAFLMQTSLTGVIIPDSVIDIGQAAFSVCSNLTIANIPEGITFICDGTFNDCVSLIGIIIPEGVTHIGNSAFYNCESLTSIIIPESVVSIDETAFAGCINLTEINFSGTVTQWKDVWKGNNWNGRTTTPATYVQCTDGRVDMNGNIIE